MNRIIRPRIDAVGLFLFKGYPYQEFRLSAQEGVSLYVHQGVQIVTGYDISGATISPQPPLSQNQEEDSPNPSGMICSFTAPGVTRYVNAP